MKDRLKYVIDSRYFDGTCLTSMSDGFHNDYGGETIEELRIRENNPYLKAVTPSDMDKKLRLYHPVPARTVQGNHRGRLL